MTPIKPEPIPNITSPSHKDEQAIPAIKQDHHSLAMKLYNELRSKSDTHDISVKVTTKTVYSPNERPQAEPDIEISTKPIQTRNEPNAKIANVFMLTLGGAALIAGITYAVKNKDSIGKAVTGLVQSATQVVEQTKPKSGN